MPILADFGRDQFRTSERESPNLKPKQRREKENKGWEKGEEGWEKGEREKGESPPPPSTPLECECRT